MGWETQPLQMGVEICFGQAQDPDGSGLRNLPLHFEEVDLENALSIRETEKWSVNC